MEFATLFFMPSRYYNSGYLAVAETKEEALEVFKECWAKVAFREDRELIRNIKPEDLIVVDKPLLNTDAGLIDEELIYYFEKPSFFGTSEADINGVPTIYLSGEAWEVYNGLYYDGRYNIIFEAYDHLSGIKIRVDKNKINEPFTRIIWMNTNETDAEYNTKYNKVYLLSEDEAFALALTMLQEERENMVTLGSFVALWEQAVKDGDIEKARAIREEMIKIMREIEKEKTAS